MNRIRATVSAIEQQESLHRVELHAVGEVFYVITLELAEDYAIGAEVDITFKSTHVAVAKDLAGEVSISNRIEARVVEMKKGELLTDILLESRAGRFYALTTTQAAKRMLLAPGDRVTALMKASDLYLSKV